MNDHQKQSPRPDQTEQYLITAAIRLDNGYWQHGKRFSVWAAPSASGKGLSRGLARDEAMKLYPGCKIDSIVYV